MIHFRIINIIIFWAVFCDSASAQRWHTTNVEKQTSPIQARFSYLATLKYPGLSMGVELPFIKKIYYIRDSIELRKTKYKALTFNYSFYAHKTFHYNHILSVGYLFRRINTKGWYLDFEPQIGLSRTFVDGTTYEVNAAGSVSQMESAGDWFVAGNLGFAIGKQLESKNKQLENVSVFLKPSLFVFLPYNNFIYSRPAIQLGVICKLKSSFIRQHNVITKVKAN